MISDDSGSNLLKERVGQEYGQVASEVQHNSVR